MKNIIKSAIAVGLLGLAVSLYAGWISPTATLSKSSVNGPSDSLTFQRDGSAEVGVAWTEATLWYPGSGNQVLGHAGYPPHGAGFSFDEPFPSQTLHGVANGQHAVQFRLVDNNIDYQDQWLYFTGYNFGGGSG